MLTGPEYRRGVSFDEQVVRHTKELDACGGLVFVHPEWWGQPPALLKGWVDRVLRPGVAYEPADEELPEREPAPLLGDKAALVLATRDAGARSGLLELALQGCWRGSGWKGCSPSAGSATPPATSCTTCGAWVPRSAKPGWPRRAGPCSGCFPRFRVRGRWKPPGRPGRPGPLRGRRRTSRARAAARRKPAASPGFRAGGSGSLLRAAGSARPPACRPGGRAAGRRSRGRCSRLRSRAGTPYPIVLYTPGKCEYSNREFRNDKEAGAHGTQVQLLRGAFHAAGGRAGAAEGRDRRHPGQGTVHDRSQPSRRHVRGHAQRDPRAAARPPGRAQGPQDPVPGRRGHPAVRHGAHEPAGPGGDLRLRAERSLGQEGRRGRQAAGRGPPGLRRFGGQLHQPARPRLPEGPAGLRLPAPHLQRDHRRHPVEAVPGYRRRAAGGGHVQRHPEPPHSGGALRPDLRRGAEEPGPGRAHGGHHRRVPAGAQPQEPAGVPELQDARGGELPVQHPSRVRRLGGGPGIQVGEGPGGPGGGGEAQRGEGRTDLPDHRRQRRLLPLAGGQGRALHHERGVAPAQRGAGEGLHRPSRRRPACWA